MPGAAAAQRNRLAVAALGFAVAAVLSSWNPLAAPFALVVGLASGALAIRALRRPGRRRTSVAALVVSGVAVAASAVVLALTAGVGRELAGQPAVQAPDPASVSRELDAAAERTRAARERARRELEALEPPKPGDEPASGR